MLRERGTVNMEEAPGRRHFVKRAMQAIAAVGVSGNVTRAAAAADEPGRALGALPSRTLGKTGLNVPILGFGGAGLPTVWGNPLSYEDRVALVRHAFDRGVRYFDTAANYPESQAILGEALKDRRPQVCLVTKVESTQPGDVRQAVEHSLGELQTDYLDILLIHGSPGLEQMTVEQATAVHTELVKLRDERVTRFLGFSAHGHLGKALALIASGGFEVCMLSYGYIPRGHSQVWSARTTALRDACLGRAHELGMGIVAMKVIGAGMLGAWSGYLVPGFDKQRLQRLPAAAMRYVLQDDRVHVLDIGMRLKEEVEANIGVLCGDHAYTLEDRALLAEFSTHLYDTEAVRKLRVE